MVTQDKITTTIQHFIDGNTNPPTTPNTNTLDVHNPATGQVITKVAIADNHTTQQALSAAQNAFPAWAATPPVQRARILFNFTQLLIENTEKIANAITREHGKTLEDAKGEVGRGIEIAEFTCGMPAHLSGSYSENVSRGIDTYTLRQALGVCVGIAPFNFPVMVPLWLLLPAIAAGNTFVLKPSEQTPTAPMMLAELLKKAGLPDGVFNIVNGDKTAVDYLINAPETQAVSVIASTPVAEYIYTTATKLGKRAHAFGGAKNHCVVMPDVDLDKAANAIVGAAYGAAGERCMALSVAVVIGEQTADQLINIIQQKLKNIVVAPGTNAQADLGPLISAAHLARVIEYVDIGCKEGASLLADGRELTIPGNENGFFMGPTLFDNVTESMRIYQEEIFGPILCVMRVKTLEEATALVNRHEYGNGTAIFTNNGYAAREYANQVQVGMVGINIPIPVPIAYHSFGGWKRSFFGDMSLHGEENVRFYTKTKTVTQRWLDDSSQVSQPFSMPQSSKKDETND